jgi:flavin-dependent dehydrogenase
MASCNGKTDVFVIGGGPAGLAAAIAARQRGFSVTVADGTKPPIDKACGEGLLPETLAALAELGITVEPEASYRFRGIRFLANQQGACGEFSQGHGLGVRRTILHEWMIRRAEECGVRLLWQTPVAGISPVGVHLPSGFIPARWIIGADGSGSRVRLWSGLNRARRRRQRYATRRHYRICPWSEHVEIYWGTRGQAYVTPVSHDEICVVIVAAAVADAEFAEFLRDCPQLRERLDESEITSRERGAVTLMHSLLAVHSGNVALVGDASGSVDAVTGDGLRLAFRQAIALAEAMHTGDLRRYGRAHGELARKALLMGDLLLAFGKNDRLRVRVIKMLAQRPRIFDGFLAMHSGERNWGELLFATGQLGWHFLAMPKSENSCG